MTEPLRNTDLVSSGFLVRAGLLVATAALLAAGCATTSNRGPSYVFPMQSKGGDLLGDWFEGTVDAKDVELRPAGDDSAKPPIETIFAAAEIDFWAGDAERAFDRYLRLLRRRADHPLSRYAAARLYDLRDDVVDYRERIRPVVTDLSYRGLGPMTRVYLSLIGQTVLYRDWLRHRQPEPFSADGAGFPAAWTMSPKMSPWRMLDFGQSFPPESEGKISERYVSPQVAEDAEVNRRRSRPYLPGGLSLSPPLGGSGIYYLETFARVSPADEKGGGARTYWLYGNFSGGARVWIDGKQVLQRSPGEYGTPKRLRRIRLEPGRHRVLVKLAYASGSRDWFDLAFLGDTAAPTSGSGLTFRREPFDEGGASRAGVERLGESLRPSAREPALVPPERVGEASDAALYLTALAAYYDRRPEHFEPAWRELMDRHPEFAAGWGLRSQQVQTLWKLPSQKRSARALSLLRKAHESNRESLYYLLKLAERLQSKDSNRDEVEKLLDIARRGAFSGSPQAEEEGRLRNIRPLKKWASYLADRGWSAQAETAWERVVEAAPSDCSAARELHGIYADRSYYPPLEKITADWKSCPGLREARLRERPERTEEMLALYRKRVARYPYQASYIVDYVNQLVATGDVEGAVDRLERAVGRQPWSGRLWQRLAELELRRNGTDAAVETLERAIEKAGHSASLLTSSSELRNEIPLSELLVDGRKVAMEHLEGGTSGEIAGSSDAAYYVVDYAARQYMPNGVSRTVTHILVRVMTKGALDDYGEQSIPGNAELLRIRTINQDGTTRVPERQPGKSTYSMPALDPGDFIELAYLRYDGPSSLSRTHREGVRFFFKMSGISSLHSEYTILGTEDGDFIRKNGPPEAEPFSEAGYEGVHFVRENSPRPRRERFSVSGAEFLPWIQYHRGGLDVPVFEARRRRVVDTVLGSLRPTSNLDEHVEQWRDGAVPSSERAVRNLFYGVVSWLSQPSPTSFGREVNHALVSKQGSPHLLLKAALDRVGIPAELYLVKSAYEHPDEFPIREFYKYRRPLIRVKVPGESAVWLDPSHRDAMYGALDSALLGQPAVCVSCREPNRQTVPDEPLSPAGREVSVDATLKPNGTLSGTATLTYRGVRASNLRGILRRNPDSTARRKYFDRLVGRLVPGASSTGYTLRREDARSRPLVVEVDFERSHFASSPSEGVLRVQSPLLREPLASIYAKLKTRERPMLVTRRRASRMKATIALPEGADASLRRSNGNWGVESSFGTYRRRVEVKDGEVSVTSKLDFPIQRVGTDEYGKFRKWAIRVERSSRLLVEIDGI
ncbi:MAG: tetratricopeptide repeat protein [Bradymonadaceae bacterium]